MNFTKAQALGNDFVILADLDNRIALTPDTISMLCDRRLGIGADGLLLVRHSDEADYEMVFYNADGSRAEICGNGLRCFGKYVFEKNLTGKQQLTVLSGGTSREVKLLLKNGLVDKVAVDMGKPEFRRSEIPMLEGDDTTSRATLKPGNKKMLFYGVSMGNPHAVTIVDNAEEIPLAEWGGKVETDPIFPQRTNVEFIQILDRNRLRMRVWERGVGITPACGSGACAAGVIARKMGLVESRMTVILDGGELHIEWDTGKSVKMTGPAELVYEGSIEI